MRWALVGASDVAARRMIPAIAAAGDIVTRVYSRDIARARAFAAVHDIPSATASLDEVFERGVDLVYVSSRNELHVHDVLAAVGAGRPVLCEKPLATSMADAAAMVSAAESAGVVLAVDHHLRSTKLLRQMARHVRDGLVGDVLAARLDNAIMLSDRLRGWRLKEPMSGGVALDLGVHDADTLAFVLGMELREVAAFGASQAFAASGVEDALVSVQRFGESVLATTHDAYTVPYRPTSIELCGSIGVLTAVDALRPDLQGELWWSDERGRRKLELSRWESPYARVVRTFRQAVEEGSAPDADGRDGLRSLAGALALRQSITSGKAVAVNSLEPAE